MFRLYLVRKSPAMNDNVLRITKSFRSMMPLTASCRIVSIMIRAADR